MVEVKRYTFAFRKMGITLDDEGHEVETRLADDYESYESDDYDDHESERDRLLEEVNDLEEELDDMRSELRSSPPLSLKKKRKRAEDRLNQIVDPGHLAKNRKRLPNELTAPDGHPQSKARSPSEHLHELALAEQRQFPNMGYSQAAHRVIDQNPKITRMYASETNGSVRVHVYPDLAGDYGDPSEHVTRMAKSMVDNDDAKNFKEAVTKVLIERPKLAVRYAEWTSNPANVPEEPPKMNMMTQAAARQIVKAHHERIKRDGIRYV